MNSNEIKEIAVKVKKKLKGKTDFVSVENYLKTKGYKVIFFNTPVGDREIARFHLESKAENTKAFTYMEVVNIVFIDDTVTNDDKNYLLYHELGHIALSHIDYERMSTINNHIMEFEADTFAHFFINCDTNRLKHNITVSAITAGAVMCLTVAGCIIKNQIKNKVGDKN